MSSVVRRVIVGASGSPSSLRALHYARHLARDLEATLVLVLAWLPTDGGLADRRTPCEELRRLWARPGDLRVAGAGRRGALARIVGGRVSRNCLARAPCPVLTSRRPRSPKKRAAARWHGRDGAR